MNRKIVGSIILVFALAVGIVGVSRALFTDTETSRANTFTAGKLDLKIDDNCTYNGEPVASCNWLEKDLTANDVFFNYADVKPGDTGENTISLKVVDNPAWVCAYVQNLTNQENTCTGPEALVDSSCDPSTGNGELQNHLLMTIWRDTNCDNKLDVASVGHCISSSSNPVGCPGMDQTECSLFALNGDCSWIPPTTGEQVLVNNTPIDTHNGVWPLYAPGVAGGNPLPGNIKACLGVSWNVPLATGNDIQSDSVTGDIRFYAAQSRNNPNFVCPAATAN